MGSDWRLDELEGQFANIVRQGRRGSARRGFRPGVDVFRSDDPPSVTVVADLAGVDPADLELSFSEGALTIAGLRRRAAVGDAVYQQIELDYGPFERRVVVGEDVEAGRAQATFDRGLLTIRFPVAGRQRPPVRVVIAVMRS